MKTRTSLWSLRSIGLLLALGFIIQAGSCSSKEDKKAKHLERAHQYIQKDELQKAVIELKNVIQLDPKNDAAYLDLGETYLKLKQGSEAFQAFSKAVGANPENLKAQMKMGQIFLLGRKPDEARKKAELVLEKAPNDIEALSLLSGVQVQERDVDGAIKTLEKAVSISPKHFNTRLSLARLFVLKGERDRAEKAYEEAISIDPKSNVPYIELSRLYGTKGEMDKAEEELKKMIQASGSNYQNVYALAVFYESTGKHDQAEKTYLEGVSSSPKEDVLPLMNLGSYYARRNSYEKALEAMKKAAEIKKDDLNILVGLAQLHFDFRKVEEAEQTVDKVLEKDKGHVGANFLKGRLYLTKRDYPHAVERLDLVLKERPRSDMAHYFRALALTGKGEIKLAEQDLLKTVEFNPGHLDARLILAEIYLRDRNKDLARQQIEPLMKVAPKDIRVLTLQGNLKALEQDAKGAEEALKKVVDLNPDYAPGHVRLGVHYGATGRQKDAEKSFKRALELNPQQTDALALITGMYVREKKLDEALQFCEEQKKKMGQSPSGVAFAEYLQGNISMGKKDTAKALQHFEKAVEIDPNILASYEAIARIHITENRIEQARTQYESIVQKNPKYIAGYMALGTLWDQQGDRKKAETYYKKALEINKDFAPAANNLAWNIADGGGNIDEALGLAQMAKEKMPKSAAVMDTLGWVYYLKGSYLNAIAQLQDGVELDADNAVINYHLGMAYFRNRQPDKAKESLEKALKLDQGFKGADQARNTLKEIESSLRPK